MQSPRFIHGLFSLVLLVGPTALWAQDMPEALRNDILIAQVAEAPVSSVRLAHDPTTGSLWSLSANGNLYELALPYVGGTLTQVFTAEDHGTAGQVLGFAIDAAGTFYLVGNVRDDAVNTATIRRGTRNANGDWTWTTVAQTEPFPRSNTPFDHNFNSITPSPDGQFLFVNSGSRTDHGEVQDNEGRYPGLREIPLTSAIFRIPADATDLILPNDEAALDALGVLFADGVRNSFDQAFDADRRLFGSENAGDRDDNDELNWLREGHHYGFPWRMGQSDTPMQFAGYNPAQDALLHPEAFGVQNGYFYNDPAYPSPPDGLTFTPPIANLGPDANRLRDPADGRIKDADDLTINLGTFTSHRSPLGLVFDTDAHLPPPLTGDALVLSWTNTDSPLLTPYGDESEDLLHLDLVPQGDTFAARVTRLVRGFINPIDAVLLGDKLYVIEFGDGVHLWQIDFANVTATETIPETARASLTVFPHPVSAESTLEVMIPRTQSVRLAVYDLLGREVAVLHDGVLAGDQPHRFVLDVPLVTGVYLVRLTGATMRQSTAFIRMP